MQIKKLEEALGQPVLLRGPRHLEVTPVGTELLPFARRMLELQQQTQVALLGPAPQISLSDVDQLLKRAVARHLSQMRRAPGQPKEG